MPNILLTFAAALAVQMPAMDHGQMGASAAHDMAPPTAATPAGFKPREPGQAAYAALGEVVRILLADPQTDWSKVDVGRLRNHLVDMDNVTMRAEVATTRLPSGARFAVTGGPDVAPSIQRMTQSHFAEPDVGTGWAMTSESISNGAIVTVTSADPAQAARIAALGFFGILTMGAHHQPHHLMMARGGMRH